MTPSMIQPSNAYSHGGVLLNDLIRYPPVAESELEFFNLLQKLRDYTRNNLSLIKPYPIESESQPSIESIRKATLDFVAGALSAAMPPEWERWIKLPQVVNKLLTTDVVKFFEKPSIAGAAKMALQYSIKQLPAIAGLIAEDPISQSIRIRRYRQTANQLIDSHRQSFETFWREHGWLT